MSFTRLHISVFLALSATAWAAVLFAQGVPIQAQHLAPFGTVVSVLALSAIALEHYLWRLPFLQGWFVARPDVRGTWAVALQSDWIDPNTGATIPPITCFMGVEQTLSTLQMHLMTPESESWFVAHSIRRSPSENGYQIVGVYTNKPNVHLRSGRSAMHLGGLVLDTHGSSKAKPTILTAEYWTDRKTTGRMTFSDRMDRVYTRYEDAAQALRSDANTLPGSTG